MPAWSILPVLLALFAIVGILWLDIQREEPDFAPTQRDDEDES